MAAFQPIFQLHVHQDIADDLFQPRLARQHLLHGAPALLQLRLGQIVQPLGFQLEPLIDLRLRCHVLVDIPRLIAQVEHDTVRHRLVEFVGVDIGAEHFEAGLLVRFQQRRAGETDEHRIRQDRLHRLVQIAALRAVAFIDKDVHIALGTKILRQRLTHLFDVAADISVRLFLAAEFVDQRAQQPGRRIVQLRDQVGAACAPHNVLVDALEYLLDLLVQLGAVGDHQHAGVFHVFPYPLGQPHHRQAFARPLGVPDDPALAPPDLLLRGAHAKILVVAAGLFHPGVEHQKVVDHLQKPILGAQPQQRGIQRRHPRNVGQIALVAAVDPVAVIRVFFAPRQPVFFLRADHAIAQPLGIIARHDHLHGGEKPLDEHRLLIVEVLTDAFGHRHGRAFQFQHAQRDPVDINHHVRALAKTLAVRCARLDRHLFGDGEMVGGGVFPVDQPDRLGLLAHIGLYLHAIAQQVIDGAVDVIQAARLVGGHACQVRYGLGDQGGGVTLGLKMGAQTGGFDVGVSSAVSPVAQIVIAKLVLKQLDHTPLRPFLDLPYRCHINRTLPVSSSCIMPCLTARALAA